MGCTSSSSVKISDGNNNDGGVKIHQSKGANQPNKVNNRGDGGNSQQEDTSSEELESSSKNLLRFR
eukprot:gnl/Chilomastix_caulleri/1488.p1 GENE.gnl/Chilomastix_caulleri/1488~~gnl/Chilomastix_caulleri/1488.p1  ORF type:complete len:66 (+),score=6.78 gnl/Chilomastix_caulleri/1488:239-436(+)